MKKHFLTASFLCLICSVGLTQIPFVRLSPAQKIDQRVGMTDVTLEYSRPTMKGRKIMGGLVPYNEYWRAGANENTKITFSEKVMLKGKEIAPGTYALFTKPGMEAWEVFLYSETNNLDVPKPLDNSKIIAQVSVPANTTEKLEEMLTMSFHDVKEDAAILRIAWEYTFIDIPFTFFPKEIMERKILETNEKYAGDLMTAATYYFQRDMEDEKALELIEKSIATRAEPNSWSYYIYAGILRNLNRPEKATAAANVALGIAKEKNYTGLIKQIETLLEELKSKK